MDLTDAIRGRRSVRVYTENLVPFNTVAEIVNLSAHAPSACNRRGWRTILIERRESLEWLRSQGGSSILSKTSQALLVCYEADTENKQWADNIQSAAAFIAYFQLIAHEHGLGSCWICHLPPQNEVMEYFSIPAEYAPVAVVTFGYYQSDSISPARRDVSELILSREKWGFSDVSLDISGRISPVRRILRKIYYHLPFRSLLRPFAERFEKKFDA